MQAQTGFRFRCYPTAAQAQILLRWIGCQRFIYNAKVTEDRYYRKFARKALDQTGIYPPVDQQYSRYIHPDLTPWLKEVPSQVLRNGAVRWRQAYARYFQGLGGRPVIRKKIGRQAVWLTSELFVFHPIVDTKTGEVLGNRLTVGNRKFAVGDILFNAHKDYRIPNSIRIGIEGGQWFLSFSNEDLSQVPDEAETVEWLRKFSEEELLARTFGGDRGVEIPLAGNHGETFDFEPIQKDRMAKKVCQTKRYQRKMARQRTQAVKEKRPLGANYRKTKKRLAKSHQYGKNVREDFAHKTSRAIVHNAQNLLMVYEDLNVEGMTKKPKAKKDENGKWAKNRAAAKAGLSKKILTAAWGKTVTFTKYKAIKAGKLCIKINPYQTSQECAECGHIHPDNRVSQSEFVCQACGHQDNADHNAGRVIARRGVRLLLSGGYKPKEVKRCGIFRQKAVEVIGPVRSESTPGESIVSHVIGNGAMQGTWNQEPFPVREETPATTA
ncbi:RNA-guided endonuclease InsQ/TnpB family protein [Acidithiobacillus sp.]